MARPKKYSTPEEAYRAKLASNARREASIHIAGGEKSHGSRKGGCDGVQDTQ